MRGDVLFASAVGHLRDETEIMEKVVDDQLLRYEEAYPEPDPNSPQVSKVKEGPAKMAEQIQRVMPRWPHVPLSIGVATRGTLMSKQLEMGQPIPASSSCNWTNYHDNSSSLLFRFFAGERGLVKDNWELDGLTLDLPIDRGPRNTADVVLSVRLCEQGVLRVKAANRRGGNSTNATFAFNSLRVGSDILEEYRNVPPEHVSNYQHEAARKVLEDVILQIESDEAFGQFKGFGGPVFDLLEAKEAARSILEDASSFAIQCLLEHAAGLSQRLQAVREHK